MLFINKEKMVFVQAFMLILFLSACGIKESRPSYELFENNIPNDSLRIEWVDGKGLVNIDAVEKSLSNENRVLFSKSLEWYATEGRYSLEQLDGLSAKKMVDLVNCLKTKEKESDGLLCFNLE